MIIYFVYAYVFVLGLVFGSFFNVVGLRLAEGHSILFPPSHCPSCGHRLKFYELVPVLSYICLRGKCRSCGWKISWLYPFVEAFTGALFLSIFIVSPTFSEIISGFLLVSLLMIVLAADISYMIIPNRVLLYFSVIFIIFRLFSPLYPWWDSLAGSAAGFALLYLILVVSNGGIGGGDVKLFAVIGYLVGTRMLVFGFFFTIMYGALLGAAGMLAGLVKKRQPVPFGPFIVLGMLTAYFFSDNMIRWYLQL